MGVGGGGEDAGRIREDAGRIGEDAHCAPFTIVASEDMIRVSELLGIVL